MGLAKIMGQMGLDGSGFLIGAKQVESEAQRLSTKLNSSLKGQLAGILGVGFFEEAIRRTIQFGAEISDLAKRAGVTAEAFQKMSFAFGGGEQVSGFFDKLNENRAKALQQGPGGETSQAFSKLGIGQAELKSDTGEVLMSKIGAAIKAGNIQELIGPLREVGGRGAGEMVAGFKKGYEQLADEAKKAGAIMSDEQVALMAGISRQMNIMGNVMRVDTADAVVWLVNKFYDLIGVIRVTSAYLGGLASTLDFKKIFSNLLHTNISFKDLMNPATLLKTGKLGALGEISRQLGSASPAADAAAKAESDKLEEERKARLKYLKDTAAAPAVVPDFAALLKGTESTKEEITPEKMSLHVDSLAKMGGFVGGAGSDNVIISIQRKQLTEQQKTAGGVEKILTHIQGVLKSTTTTRSSSID